MSYYDKYSENRQAELAIHQRTGLQDAQERLLYSEHSHVCHPSCNRPQVLPEPLKGDFGALHESEGATFRGRRLPLDKISDDISSGALVQRLIFQKSYYFNVWKKDVQIRSTFTLSNHAGGGKRGVIRGFSRASQRRLSFVARNAGDKIKSQFLLTYHKTEPDGQKTKKHLNQFLTQIRQKFPNVEYLWILEFHRNNKPHYHFFSTLPVRRSIQHWLAIKWNRITGESPEHKKVHDHFKNFINWNMGSGSYVTKYLQKMEQKGVPEGFKKVGRMWGNSRDLVPKPFVCTQEEILSFIPGTLVDKQYIIKQVKRTLAKYYERQLRQIRKKRVNKRNNNCSLLIPFGTDIFFRLLDYYSSGPLLHDYPVPF